MKRIAQLFKNLVYLSCVDIQSREAVIDETRDFLKKQSEGRGVRSLMREIEKEKYRRSRFG